MTPQHTIQLKLLKLHLSGSVSLDDLQRWADGLSVGIHVAIMREPYLSKVISGEKYIELRLTKVNVAPFERASAGDVILFKRSGGAMIAAAVVKRAEFRRVASTDDLNYLVKKHADGLGYEPGYVETKRQAKFVSLLWLGEVSEVPATRLVKRGHQAWITFQASENS